VPTKIEFDCATGETREVEMKGAELAAHEAASTRGIELAAADQAAAQDLSTRRAAIIGDLQALRDATTLAAFRAPMLRVLVFLLRRIGERDQ